MVARKSASDKSWPSGIRSPPSSTTMRPLLISARRLRTAPRAKRSMIAGRRARAAPTPDATMESDLAIVKSHAVTRPPSGTAPHRLHAVASWRKRARRYKAERGDRPLLTQEGHQNRLAMRLRSTAMSLRARGVLRGRQIALAQVEELPIAQKRRLMPETLQRGIYPAGIPPAARAAPGGDPRLCRMLRA